MSVGDDNFNPKINTSKVSAPPLDKPSFVSIVHGNSNTKSVSSLPDITRSITLPDHDLISVDDSSRVILVKLKEVDTMSNMYSICKNEGFTDLKIHHVGGLWVWIQFPSVASCMTFNQMNA